MARAAADKPYVNFSNGLVTEVTRLNYPENSLLDIENMDIDIDGSVRRRLGIEPEVNAVATGIETINGAHSTHIWNNPGGREGVTFLVVQVGNFLYIRNAKAKTVNDLGAVTPLTFTTKLIIPNDYLDLFQPGGASAALAQVFSSRMRSANGFGCLFLFCKGLRPIYLDYSTVDNTIKIGGVGAGLHQPNAISNSPFQFGAILYRDFKGAPKEWPIDYRPKENEISDLHMYNLRNAGWVKAIKEFRAKFNRWPSLADQYIFGLDAEGNFDANLFNKIAVNGSPAPTGYTLLNAHAHQRSSLHGWTNIGNTTVRRMRKKGTHLSDEVEVYTTTYVAKNSDTYVNSLSSTFNERSDSMFQSGAFFAGRLWMTADVNRYMPNAVYFSKVIQEIKDAGFCAQVNDPTSDEISDLLDSDGGVIYLHQAEGILDIQPLGEGLIVLANAGVWFIRGGEAGFAATAYSVDKISDVKCINRDSVVVTEDAIYFLATNGVYGIGFDGVPGIKNLSDERIFSFYQQIPTASLENCFGTYDRVSKKVFWFYRQLEEESEYRTDVWVMNRALIMDGRNGSFTKYSLPYIYDTEANHFGGIVAAFPRYEPVTASFNNDVFVGLDQVFDGVDVVEYGEEFPTNKDEKYINNIKMVMNNYSISSKQFFFTDFKGLSFKDVQGTLVKDYDSYLVTQPESLADLQRDKSATYVYSYFKRTEGLFLDAPDGSSRLDRPSSAYVQGLWDWNGSAAGNRWSQAQQAYKFKKPVVGDVAGTSFDNGETVVYTKRKVRGNGRALSLKYQAESGKDMHLLGISVAFTANGV